MSSPDKISLVQTKLKKVFLLKVQQKNDYCIGGHRKIGDMEARPKITTEIHNDNSSGYF